MKKANLRAKLFRVKFLHTQGTVMEDYIASLADSLAKVEEEYCIDVAPGTILVGIEFLGEVDIAGDIEKRYQEIVCYDAQFDHFAKITNHMKEPIEVRCPTEPTIDSEFCPNPSEFQQRDWGVQDSESHEDPLDCQEPEAL